MKKENLTNLTKALHISP